MIKRGWLFLAILFVFAIIFLNLSNIGFNVLNTTSNVTIGDPNEFPSIVQINNTLFTCEGSVFYYEFNASDSDGDVLSSTITPSNPFFVFWIRQSAPNIHTFAIVSGLLSKSHAGGANAGSNLFQETIIVSDNFNSTCCTDSDSTNITVIEKNNAPVIEDIGVKTLYFEGDNSSLYEVVSVNDTEYGSGYGSLAFNVSIVNATSGSQINLFNISSPDGIINFSVNNSVNTGVYNVTVCVNDTALTNTHPNISVYCGQNGGSLSACDNFSITITNDNRAPYVTSYFPYNNSFSHTGTSQLYFNLTSYDPDGTVPDLYWYVDGVEKEYDSGSLFNEFNHTFGCGVSGVHNVTANLTDGLLNYTLNWSINVIYAPCGPFGGGGGGGGGGGRGPGIVPIRFSVSPEFITSTIYKEQGISYDVKVRNDGDNPINISANLVNLSQMAILSDEIFTLNAREEKTLRVYLYALKSAKPGVYFGKILFRSGGVEKSVSIVLEVKDKEALFDLKVRVPTRYKSVNPGNDVLAMVDMLNVGLYGTDVDVTLYLYVSNFDKFIIYESSKEVLAVKTNLTVDRLLHVPLDTPGGPYLVIGEMRYDNFTISSYDTFNVIEKRYLRAGYILIIIAIILIIILILFIIWKRRKKKKEDERYK